MGELRIHFTAEDVAKTTIARHPDPMWETICTLHRFQTRLGSFAFAQWNRQVRQDLRSARFGPHVKTTLLPLVPLAAYFPDFLTPEPMTDDVELAIDAVLATPTERIDLELRGLADAGRVLPSWAIDLAEGRAGARRWLGSVLQRYFDLAVRPYWGEIERVVAQDRMVRTAAAAREGLAAIFGGLSPDIVWEPPVLRARLFPRDCDLYLRGRGITLIPSYFCWGGPITLFDPERTPVLVYSAMRGATDDRRELIDGAGRGATALLGATRVALLRAASVSLTTTELAKVVGISPATASHHTAILRRAGLIHSRRSGNMMLHLATPMATHMLRHDGGPPPVEADPGVVPSGTRTS
jgi:DNA-binding transcriptional ArsR family regulator